MTNRQHSLFDRAEFSDSSFVRRLSTSADTWPPVRRTQEYSKVSTQLLPRQSINEHMSILYQTMTHVSGNGCQCSHLGSCTCMGQCRYLHSDTAQYTELFGGRSSHLPCSM
ncbi:hypothetical protein E2C01_011284 [Portunus trituberculatus]|uniref:Uncharacterized protein n=1 Tax=Portunus trituberculatus TaxID=210409 RepID=A0A5B7DB00_PORTR|nr:hypothetical protein [Portunus trituberculatus]